MRELQELIDFEVVKILHLRTVQVADPYEEPLHFRLEVLKSWAKAEYHARLYRFETYDLVASMSREKKVIPVKVLVLDSCNDWELIIEDTPDLVVEAVLKCPPFTYQPK